MPRCLMAKKWKAYPWPERPDDDEEIDVVGVEVGGSGGGGNGGGGGGSQGVARWGPASPAAADPPPCILYNGYGGEISSMHFTAYLPRNDAEESAREPVITSTDSQPRPSPPQQPPPSFAPPGKSLAMCYTSTGAALSLPPKKKDIYRPYSLDDRREGIPEFRTPAEEDLHAAHAILDLSQSAAFLPVPPLPPPQPPIIEYEEQVRSPSVLSDKSESDPKTPSGEFTPGKTVAYTYEAFFVSDGRSKRKNPVAESPNDTSSVSSDGKTKYACGECGKRYATSSNLSRHKQTHRSLDSQAAKKCITCGKAYVSMPALAMHVLTHKLSHVCGVCGKLFSRPWLLQGHLRSHTGEKPYGCAHCGKAFADRSNLRAHMQTHSSDKNFECSRCHKSFALKSYLNKHLESACFKEGESDSQDGSVVQPNAFVN